MGLSLDDLTSQRDIIHDVPLSTIEGETVKIRELGIKQVTDIFENHANEDGSNLNEEGTRLLVMAAVTDDDGATMSREQVDDFFVNAQLSVLREVVGHVSRLHAGTESGES